MRELVLKTLSDQADIEITGEVGDEADILERVEKTNQDFVVIAQDQVGERPSVCDTVLRQRPDVRIIAVAARGNYSIHYWASLKIHSRDVEASEEALLGVLRTKASSIDGLT